MLANNKTTSNSSDGENISLTELNYCGTQQPGLNSSPDLRLAQPPEIEQISRASWSNRRPIVLLRFSDQVSTIDMSEHSPFLSPATSPHKEPSPLAPRRSDPGASDRSVQAESHRRGPFHGRGLAHHGERSRRRSQVEQRSFAQRTHAELLLPPTCTPSRPLPK